jgi:hypothetical protein
LPVPPLPVTTCRRTADGCTTDGTVLTRTSVGAGGRPGSVRAALR